MNEEALAIYKVSGVKVTGEPVTYYAGAGELEVVMNEMAANPNIRPGGTVSVVPPLSLKGNAE